MANTKTETPKIAVSIPLDAVVIREWKSYLREKRSKLQQEGRLARIRAVLTVLNRSKESLNFATRAEAEAVRDAMKHYLYKEVGQPRIQYYLLSIWKGLANKKVNAILERKNGTDIELHSTAEFERILADIDLRIKREENARAFATQKLRVEEALERFKPLEAVYNMMDGVVEDLDNGESDSAPKTKKRKKKTTTSKKVAKKKKKSKKTSKKKKRPVRKVNQREDESASAPAPAPVTEEPAAAEPQTSEDSTAPTEEEEVANLLSVDDDGTLDSVVDATDEELAREAAMTDMDDEELEDDPFLPEDEDVDLGLDLDDDDGGLADDEAEVMSTRDIARLVDGEDDPSDDQWNIENLMD